MKKNDFTVRNSNGFTLLEVILFLAISSGLALIAFIGLGPRLRNVRFTDSVRGLQASVVRNMGESELGGSFRQSNKVCTNVENTVTIKDGNQSAGSSQACVLNGRVAHFENNEVTYRDIVSFREPDGCPGKSAEGSFDRLKKCFRPMIVEGDRDTYNYNNGLRLVTVPDAPAIGIIRNPKNGEEYTFQLKNISDWGWVYFGQLDNAGFSSSDSFETGLCFAQGGRNATLQFSSKKVSPKIIFDEGCST